MKSKELKWQHHSMVYLYGSIPPLHTYAFLKIISPPRAFLTQFHQIKDGSLTVFVEEHEILMFCQIAVIYIGLSE